MQRIRKNVDNPDERIFNENDLTSKTTYLTKMLTVYATCEKSTNVPLLGASEILVLLCVLAAIKVRLNSSSISHNNVEGTIIINLVTMMRLLMKYATYVVITEAEDEVRYS